MRRKIFILTMSALLILGAPPAQAANPLLQKWFPFFFPQEDTGPKPEDTLQAPFSTAAPVGEGLQTNSNPANTNALHVPHRAERVIGEWAITAASQALTFESDDYKTDLQKLSAQFDKAGYNQYLQFLQDNKITNVLASKNFYVRSFVQDAPVLLNAGNVDGRYRWLYEVPMMISYMDRSMKNYRKTEGISQKLILRIQLGRVSETAQNPEGLLIETWAGKLEKLDKQ